VHLAGVVTVSAGFVGSDALLAIQDSSGGVFVRLATPVDGLKVGRSLEVVGVLAAPYGQLEVRQLQVLVLGSSGPAPSPVLVQLGEIGEQSEGSLVSVRGTVNAVQTDTGRLSLVLGDGQSVLRVLADPRTGLTTADIKRGSEVVVTGVVGQRATALGRQDGYRLWLRSRTDLVIEQSQGPVSSNTPSPSPSPSGPAIHSDIASALGKSGSKLDVNATVTASVGLIDTGGPTIVVDDGSAACAVGVPDGTGVLRVGSRVHIVGKMGSWHGGSRILATLVQATGEVQAIQSRQVGGALTAQLEWQLVQASGRIDRVTRVGVRWRADLLVAGTSVAVLGEPSAGIAASSVLPGHVAVVVGIVRRSTSKNGEFELLPRSPLDLRLGPSLDSPIPQGSSGSAALAATGASMHADIASLPGREGQSVVVSGVVVIAEDGSVTVDDGTGRTRIGGEAAAEALSLLETGDAIEARGLVRRDAAGWFVEVDPGSIVVLSAIGDPAMPSAAASVRVPTDVVAALQPAPLAGANPGLSVWLVAVALLLVAGVACAFALRRGVWRAGWSSALLRARNGRQKASEEAGKDAS